MTTQEAIMILEAIRWGMDKKVGDH